MTQQKETKVINLDINTILLSDNGVENFYWPILPYKIVETFAQMTRRVVSVLRDAQEQSLPGVDAGIVLNIFFVQEAIACYRARLLIDQAQQDGYIIHPSGRNRLVGAFLRNELPGRGGVLIALKNGPSPLKIWRSPLRIMRDIVVGHKDKMVRQTLFPVDYQTQIISLSASSLATFLAKESEQKVFYRRPNVWFKAPNLKDIDSADKYKELVCRLILAINDVFTSKSVFFSKEIKLHLSQWLEEGITLVEHYLAMLNNQENKIPFKLWANTGGNIWGRILARCVKKHNGQVFRESHGGGAGYFNSSRAHGFLNYEDCDVFYCYSKAQAQSFAKQFTDKNIVQMKRPEFFVINNKKYFSNSVQVCKRNSLRSDAKKKIMYVGSIYPGEHVYSCARGVMDDIVYLDWELRLLKQLQTWGYDVILKPHPAESNCLAAPAAIEKIFGKIILNKPFEHVFHQADVIILDTPVTSLFPTLVLSCKPFVYLDFKVQLFSQEAYAMLSKRCPIVKGFYNDNNRACIDWKKLRSAIEIAHQYQDREFYEKYFMS